jgi:hypothetical protein
MADIKKDRRMALLKRVGLFSIDTKGSIICRAISAEDLILSYRLVHDIFVEKKYILPQKSGIRLRITEALPSTATFVAENIKEIVGVQSIAVDSNKIGLPSDNIFHNEIDILRVGGKLLCEATNQAIAIDYRNTAVSTELMRCMFAHALSIGCDELITTISPGHVKFFELLGFKQISSIKSYSTELYDPVVVVRVNIHELIERTLQIQEEQDNGSLFVRCRCLENNPYRHKVNGWTMEASKTFKDIDSLHRLFVDSSFLKNCPKKELEIICEVWGKEIFNKVNKGV